jgi:hypothetical protein
VFDNNRRSLLVRIAVLTLVPSFVRFADASVIVDPAPTVANDVDEFIRLSELITGTQKLDRNTAQEILICIQNEPWGKEHLGQIARKLLPQYSQAPLPVDRAELLNPSRFEEGERWFIGHFLTTWFTGVYFHQSSRVVSYEHALMFASLDDVRPSPSHCAGEFGFWSAPPAKVA